MTPEAQWNLSLVYLVASAAFTIVLIYFAHGNWRDRSWKQGAIKWFVVNLVFATLNLIFVVINTLILLHPEVLR